MDQVGLCTFIESMDQMQTQTRDRSGVRAPGEEEEPPSAGDHGSMRDFTNRQMYKRVWVGGRNMAVMVAETTWAPLAGPVGDGSLRRVGGGDIVPE
jgi:hypothetical protein